MADSDPPIDDSVPEKNTAPTEARLPTRGRTAYNAVLAVLGPGVALFTGLQSWFQPFAGQGVTGFVLTALVLLLILCLVALYQWWRTRRRRLAIPVVLALLLVVVSAGTGFAVSAIVHAPGEASEPPSDPPPPTDVTGPTTTQSTPTWPTTGSGGATMSPSSTQVQPTTDASRDALPASGSFGFDQVRDVPWCSTFHGNGTTPPEGATVLMITQADEFKLYYEKPVDFDSTGRWRASSVVIGNPADRTDFYVIAYAVTPAKAAELAETKPGDPIGEEPGRQLTKMLVTRVGPDTC